MVQAEADTQKWLLGYNNLLGIKLKQNTGPLHTMRTGEQKSILVAIGVIQEEPAEEAYQTLMIHHNRLALEKREGGEEVAKAGEKVGLITAMDILVSKCHLHKEH